MTQAGPMGAPGLVIELYAVFLLAFVHTGGRPRMKFTQRRDGQRRCPKGLFGPSGPIYA